MIKIFDLDSLNTTMHDVPNTDVISVPIPQPTNPKLNAIQKLPSLGAGAYGKIYALDDKNVLKIINLRYSNEYEDSPLQEIAIGRWIHRNNLPFLTPITETELIEGHLIMKMPRAECDLFKMNKNKMSPVLFAIDILKGLLILHNENILHGDFRPDNVLFFKDGSVKITDFGHSRIINSRKNVHLGISFYDAPEATEDDYLKLDSIQQLKYDVWAYAVTIAEMIVPMHSYKLVNKLNYKRLIEKYRSGVSKKYGSDHILTKIMNYALIFDVKSRCTSFELYQMIYTSKLVQNLKFFEIKLLTGGYFNTTNIDFSVVKEVAEQYEQNEATAYVNFMFICIWNRFNRDDELMDECYALALEVILDRMAPKHMIESDDHYYLAKRIDFDILNLRQIQVLQNQPIMQQQSATSIQQQSVVQIVPAQQTIQAQSVSKSPTIQTATVIVPKNQPSVQSSISRSPTPG